MIYLYELLIIIYLVNIFEQNSAFGYDVHAIYYIQVFLVIVDIFNNKICYL